VQEIKLLWLVCKKWVDANMRKYTSGRIDEDILGKMGSRKGMGRLKINVHGWLGVHMAKIIYGVIFKCHLLGGSSIVSL